MGGIRRPTGVELEKLDRILSASPSSSFALALLPGILTEKVIQSAVEALIKDEADYSRHENMEILSNLLIHVRQVWRGCPTQSPADNTARLLSSTFPRAVQIGSKLEAGGGRSSKDGKLIDGYFAKVRPVAGAELIAISGGERADSSCCCRPTRPLHPQIHPADPPC